MDTLSKTDPHLEKFERFEREASHPSWVFPLRKAGIARFAELGFPTLQQEDWRFTNVAPITKLPFKPIFQPSKDGLTQDALSRFTFARLSARRLVFINGHYAPDLSSPGAQEHGLVVSSLAHALTENSALTEKHLARYASGEDNAFAALNTAFFQDGAFIFIPSGRVLEEPVHLLFVSSTKESGITS